MLKSLFGLMGFIVFSFGIMSLSAWATIPAISGGWYDTLAKPSFTPPNWVFQPVWTTLYMMMALSAWLVWRERHWTPVKKPLWIWAGQLVLNGAWSVFFFGFKSPLWAGVEIIVLWGMVVWTIRTFWPIRGRAGALLVPYFLWLNYAMVLNFAIILMNLA